MKTKLHIKVGCALLAVMLTGCVQFREFIQIGDDWAPFIENSLGTEIGIILDEEANSGGDGQAAYLTQEIENVLLGIRLDKTFEPAQISKRIDSVIEAAGVTHLKTLRDIARIKGHLMGLYETYYLQKNISVNAEEAYPLIEAIINGLRNAQGKEDLEFEDLAGGEVASPGV